MISSFKFFFPADHAINITSLEKKKEKKRKEKKQLLCSDNEEKSIQLKLND